MATANGAIANARASSERDFMRAADPYRRELLAHCYRMLGSFHEAEDLVQETYLRAWRSSDKFEGRSSLRTWLHRIATNACLTALDGRAKRPLPTGLTGPSDDATGELETRNEVPWLEPFPGVVREPEASDPAVVVGSRESIRLAFIVALQLLPPRQRAVLLLRDVLRWRASEVAEEFGITTAAVNSALQRARAKLAEATPDSDAAVSMPEGERARQLRRYVDAFESHRFDDLVELFTSDAVWEMPPILSWFRGAATICRMVEAQCPAKAAGDLRLVPTTANGQPAFGVYLRAADGEYRPFQIHVLTIGERGVSHVVSFFDTSLFAAFGLAEG